MKYLLLIATLFILAACQPVIDTRDPATAAATRTALASAPVPALPGVLRITLLTPPPIPTIEPVLLPTVTQTPAPDCLIKGNINAQGRKIAHAPGDSNYDQVKIDESKGERIFCSMEDAIAAGWTKARAP